MVCERILKGCLVIPPRSTHLILIPVIDFITPSCWLHRFLTHHFVSSVSIWNSLPDNIICTPYLEPGLNVYNMLYLYLHVYYDIFIVTSGFTPFTLAVFFFYYCTLLLVMTSFVTFALAFMFALFPPLAFSFLWAGLIL